MYHQAVHNDRLKSMTYSSGQSTQPVCGYGHDALRSPRAAILRLSDLDVTMRPIDPGGCTLVPIADVCCTFVSLQ